MVTENQLQARKKYARPQAVLFADNATRKRVNNVMVWLPDGVEGTDWIILSDHNRTDLGFSVERIENRKRMIDATMRSYHTADKYSLSLSWSDLPSRAAMYLPTVDIATGTLSIPPGCIATIDGGAGGAELKWWYDTHPGPFYVLLHYDDYKSIDVPAPGVGDTYDQDKVQFESTKYYKHAKIMFFDSFSHDVAKRTRYIDLKNPETSTDDYVIEYDTWNVSMELVEA